MKINKQSGQAILFVVVALTIALSVAVTISARTLSSISRSTRADTTNRAFAAAEGGLERVFALNTTQFDDFLNGECVKAGLIQGTDGCIVKYNASPTSGDMITSQTIITAETFSTNFEPTNDDPYYLFNLEMGRIVEVNLKDYGNSGLTLCFRNPETALFYTVYSATEVDRGGIYRSGSENETNMGGFEIADGETKGYCRTISILSSALGIRIGALYTSGEVIVQGAAGGTLPDQGYVITSKGQLLSESGAKTTRTVKVYKSFPYLPGILDFAILTDGQLN